MSERELLESIHEKLTWTNKCLVVLFKQGKALLNQGRVNMVKLDDVLADVTAETTLIGGVSTLIQGLQAQVAAIGLSPADQAKVDAIFAGTEANKAALAAALVVNVPPAPPVTPPAPAP